MSEESNNRINTDVLSGNIKLANGISFNELCHLTDINQSILLNGHNNIKNKEVRGGLVGKFVGANIKNASVNIAFIIMVLLLTYCGSDMLWAYSNNKEINFKLWNLVFPVITLTLGYIFGNGKK